MEIFYVSITILILLILVAGLIYIIKTFGGKKEEEGKDQSILLFQKQLEDLRKEVRDGLGEQNKTLRDQMSQSTKEIQRQYAITSKNTRDITESTKKELKEVTEKLTKLDDTNRRVESFATQLQSLENILKNPKHRGILGEYFLETILGNTLPKKSFRMQYKFKNGEIVDAVIFIEKDTMVPIDAKFSLESYNRLQTELDNEKRERLVRQFKKDLKDRIDETSKYIRPEEKTTNFAFMFIPAEGLYYNLLGMKVGDSIASRDIMQYAHKKNVIIVSPNSFFAYLQTVVEGLRRLEIQEKAEFILKNITRLQRHLDVYDDNMLKLGKHLGTTVGAYNNSYKEFKKIDKDITRMTGKKEVIQPMLIDKPREQD